MLALISSTSRAQQEMMDQLSIDGCFLGWANIDISMDTTTELIMREYNIRPIESSHVDNIAASLRAEGKMDHQHPIVVLVEQASIKTSSVKKDPHGKNALTFKNGAANTVHVAGGQHRIQAARKVFAEQRDALAKMREASGPPSDVSDRQWQESIKTVDAFATSLKVWRARVYDYRELIA